MVVVPYDGVARWDLRDSIFFAMLIRLIMKTVSVRDSEYGRGGGSDMEDTTDQ